ncbi:ABC transporter ATP-binding protein [uncultured Aquimarina sp.]|uniref:ABC transporter ATP-binding protein n=1 Tax=uncultured Aquimarina sp. TaxID=575652 RepID=UPI0026166E62|nr:ABC transporter ATP-binding protein [uncultured Aquimarina sp.]
MSHILKIKQLSKSFNNGKDLVINDINLSVKKGETIAIVGESGSGKTTLTRLISGLETPDSGTISINNTEVASEHSFVPPEKRNIGLVFQDYALFPHLTVFKNIAYGLSKLENKKTRVSEMLALVNLTGYENRYPHQLSGGQQQRVALARALAPKPKLLLLDEPFSNLDVMLRVQLRNEIFDIIKKTEVTAIFVTHDTQDAIAIADKIIILQEGKKIQKGSIKKLYKKPKDYYVASLFSTISQLSEEDLTCFGYNTKEEENKKYAIRINQFKINTSSDFNLSIKIDKTVFMGDHFMHTTILPNNTVLNFTSEHKLTDQVTIGFDTDTILSFNKKQ